jgi:hypothetical protein
MYHVCAEFLIERYPVILVCVMQYSAWQHPLSALICPLVLRCVLPHVQRTFRSDGAINAPYALNVLSFCFA